MISLEQLQTEVSLTAVNQNRWTTQEAPSAKTHHQESHIQRLPPEIHSLIFQFAAPHIDFEPEYSSREGPFHWEGHKKYHRTRLLSRLGAVSISWREIINHTPALWTSFAIKISPRRLKAKTTLLRLCFENSGNLGVDLKIKFKGFLNHHFDRSEQLLELLSTHAHRVRSIRLGDPPFDLANQFDRRFTCLESLRVIWAPIHFPNGLYISTSATSLRSLSLEFASRVDLQGVNLTSLNLMAIPVDACAWFLLSSQCPNLTEYYCRYPLRPSHHPDHSVFSPSITLPHVTKFGWACRLGFEFWNDQVLSSIHLPVLDTLYWYDDHHEEEELNYPDYFSTISTLTTLRVVGVISNEDVLARFFQPLVRIQTLVLEDCQDDALQRIFCLLDPDCDLTLGEEELLPGLRNIWNIRTSGFENESDGIKDSTQVDASLAQMLLNRWTASNCLNKIRVIGFGKAVDMP